MKKLVIGLSAVVVVLVCVIATIIIIPDTPKQETTPEPTQTETTSAPFNEQILTSFKISSLTYRYSNLVYQESVAQIGNIDIPFTKAYLAVRYDGVMEIGIDASKLKISQVGNAVTIMLPPTEVLSHTLVPGTTEVILDKDGLFNHNKIADFTQLFEAEQAKMIERAAENGLLETARDNTKEQLRDFINSLPGMAMYIFNFTDSPS